MTEELKKKVIDSVTAPLFQALTDLELAESTDNAEILKYIFSDTKTKIKRSIQEYTISVEK